MSIVTTGGHEIPMWEQPPVEAPEGMVAVPVGGAVSEPYITDISTQQAETLLQQPPDPEAIAHFLQIDTSQIDVVPYPGEAGTSQVNGVLRGRETDARIGFNIVVPPAMVTDGLSRIFKKWAKRQAFTTLTRYD